MSMTRDEAIKILEAWAKCKYKPTHDAAEMAIAALRANDPPPNDPLTIEELQEMEQREWVWIKFLIPHYGVSSSYYITHKENPNRNYFQCGYPNYWLCNLPYYLYGDTWLAYRRKPEEGTT